MAEAVQKERTISPRLVRWILYNLAYLEARYEAIEPRATFCMVPMSMSFSPGESKTERVALRRASIDSVLIAVNRSITRMTPGQYKLYRMRYLARLSIHDIEKMFDVSKNTILRRLEDITEIVACELLLVPWDHLDEFRRAMRS